jgi:D-sedoheptulose 7-phosphate isomerase
MGYAMSHGTAPIVEYLARSRDAVEAALGDQLLIETIAAAVDQVSAALAAGNKVLLAGNGGSAADAQHLAGEFVGRFNYDRAPVPAIALTTDSSALTAIGNDYGYDHVFARQVLALGRPGDVLIAISTSGRSPNILKAIAAARASGLLVIGFTGKSGGDMAARSVPVCAGGFDAADPAAPHHARAHRLWAGRGAAVPPARHEAAARGHRRLIGWRWTPARRTRNMATGRPFLARADRGRTGVGYNGEGS